MKSNEIIKALGIPANGLNNKHASALSAIYDYFRKSKADIVSAEITARGQAMKFGYEDMKADAFKVTTATGEYYVLVPVANDFYNAMCNLLGIDWTPQVAPRDVMEVIHVPVSVTAVIGRAVKFVSGDNLRPAMTCVCLTFEHGKLEVTATDAHVLFMSEKLVCDYNGKRKQFLIEEADAIKISKQKPDGDMIPLSVLADDHIELAGVVCRLSDHRFPDYKVVVDAYPHKHYVSFDRKEMIQSVKEVSIYANKSTHQVVLHINGSIALSSQDVDFSFEGGKEIAYHKKTVPDMDIAFNGKLLIQSLRAFKDSKVKMYSEGKGKDCVFITNGKERVLLMPLMLNN